MPQISTVEVIQPKCPKCGSAEVQLYDTHDSYPRWTKMGDDEPSSTTKAYSCACGCSFMSVEKYSKPKLAHA